MCKNYPKVLIIGENFHSSSGGGITISNLFKEWPESKLAVADFPDNLTKVSKRTGYKVYQLGSNEFEMISPFNLLSKKHESKQIIHNDNNLEIDERIYNNSSKKSFLKRKVIKAFIFTSNLLGFFHFINKTKLSSDFISWVKDFNPDYVYTQLSRRDLILFITLLNDKMKVPLVIHIMDDWPSIISPFGLLRKYWKKRIDTEFRNLLDKSYALLSISDSMSEEYLKRYNKKFISFHNPIDIDLWNHNEKKQIKNGFIVLHAGRIGLGISSSLITLAGVIQDLREEGSDIILIIQSSSIDQSFKNKVKKYDCVKINPPVNYNDVPKIIMGSDLLLICNDFDKKGQQFLKYSWPTKASEYMISKVPILLFGPPTSGLFKHAKKNKWAFVVGEDDSLLLKNALIELMNNSDLKNDLVNNAFSYAKENFDSRIVRKKFKQIFK